MKKLLLVTLQFVIAQVFAGVPLVVDKNQNFEKLIDVNLTINGQTDIHLTSATEPMVASSVHLTSIDTWLYFDNMRPDDVILRYKDSIFVNNSVISPGLNCRISIYKHGTAIVPHGNTFMPLEVFVQPDFSGTSQQYALQVYNTTLGAYNNAIQSFKLKKGYMVTMANSTDGTGYSRCFIADKEDLQINQLPPELNKKVSFIRVFPWEWVTKKGWGGTAADTDSIKGTWRWDWSASGNSETGIEYVPIKEQKYWPSWTTISAKNTATHLMGYCEPDNGENRSTVDETIAEWPNMLKTGLRLGTPSAINVAWIYEFLDKCEAKRYRVDFVTIHCYWAAKPASQWYSDLKKIHERTKRPLWITEWNTGGNWTNEPWPTDSLQALQKQLTDIKAILNVLDTASFVERYSIYNWVENKRAMIIKNVLTPAGSYYANNKSVMSFNRSKEVVLNPNVTSPISSFSINSTGTQMSINWTDPNLELTQGYKVEKKGSDGIYQQVFQTNSFTQRFYKEDLLPMPNGEKFIYRVNVVGSRNEVASSIEMGVIGTRGNSTFQYGNAPVSNIEWNSLFLQNPFGVPPIVILGSPSYENTNPMTQSIRTIVNNSVSFRLRPWLYLGSTVFTKTETVPFVMLPSREQTIGAIQMQTGSSTINKTTWTYISFANSFSTIPVVLPTLTTTSNVIPVTIRIKDVTTTGFWALLKQEQAQIATLQPEGINYIAATPGSGTIDGKKIKVGITPTASVGGILESYRLNFDESFTKPIFLCAMQSYNDTITSSLRYNLLNINGVTLFKQREMSKSSTTVAKESVGWMLLEEAESVSGVEKSLINNISFFPNPVSDQLNVHGLETNDQISIWNMQGAKIMSITYNGNTTDVADLNKGLYLLTVNGKSVAKFIKN